MRSHIIKSATAMVCGLSIGLSGAVALTGSNLVIENPVAYASSHYVEAWSRFKDVTTETPHVDDISWMVGWDITTGYPDGTFRGMAPVYRQDMAAFLRRLAKNHGIGEALTWTPSASDWKKFKDVNENTPHAEDILWLASMGITEGFSDGTFRGMTPVYRQDMAAFLHRLANLSEGTIETKDVPAFSDINQIAHRADVEWLAATGIATGYSDGTFRGMTPVYRQDMAAFLHRLDSGLRAALS